MRGNIRLLLFNPSASAYVQDNFDRADGALGSDWVGATWAIVNRVAVNVPAVGAEIAVDPGLEQWTSPTNLTQYGESIAGTSTLNKESVIVKAGSFSCRLDIDASNSAAQFNRAATGTVNGDWVRLFSWVYGTGARTTLGTAGADIGAGNVWTLYETIHRPTGNAQSIQWGRGLGAARSIYYDELSVKKITASSLYAIYNHLLTPLVTVRAQLTVPTGAQAGLVACANAASAITDDVYAYLERNLNTGDVIKFYKTVAGVETLLFSTAVTYVAGATLEIRHPTTTTFQVWYNNVQVNADQTVSDAGIISNGYHGILASGAGCTLDAFFCSVNPPTLNVVYLGGSITNGASASNVERTSWRALSRNYLAQQYLNRSVVTFNAGVGGTPSWYGLVRLQTDVIAHAPDVVFIEFAVNDRDRDTNGSRTYGFAPASEALLRRAIGALPNAMFLIGILVFPDLYSYMFNFERVTRDKWLTLCALYGFTPFRFDTALVALMPNPYVDADVEIYLSAAGNVHPNDAGHAVIAAQADAQLTGIGNNTPLALPARYYAESADYEQTPTIRNGTDNDGETGTWSTSGTARISSAANSTIAWSGTFCSFGIDTVVGAGAGVVGWSLDGGVYTNVDLSLESVSVQPISNFTRGAHTITLKVISGTVTINRWMSI